MFLKDILPGFMRHSWTGAAWAPDATDKNEECLSIAENNHRKSQTHRATMTLHHSVVFLERFSILELNVTAAQIGPGYVELTLQTFFGPLCILQTVTPLEPLLQRVTHIMFSPQLIAPYAKIVLIGECLMFERDIAVWNHKKFEKTPILVREDRTISAYRRWYSQFYSANSPTYQTAKTLEW